MVASAWSCSAVQRRRSLHPIHRLRVTGSRAVHPYYSITSGILDRTRVLLLPAAGYFPANPAVSPTYDAVGRTCSIIYLQAAPSTHASQPLSSILPGVHASRPTHRKKDRAAVPDCSLQHGTNLQQKADACHFRFVTRRHSTSRKSKFPTAHSLILHQCFLLLRSSEVYVSCRFMYAFSCRVWGQFHYDY